VAPNLRTRRGAVASKQIQRKGTKKAGVFAVGAVRAKRPALNPFPNICASGKEPKQQNQE
jgi:hypothetical protein